MHGLTCHTDPAKPCAFVQPSRLATLQAKRGAPEDAETARMGGGGSTGFLCRLM